MPRLTLSDQERQTLEALVTRPPHRAIQRCAQALLWLDAGTTVAEVTRRLGVCRHTVYKWRRRYQSSRPPDIPAWLTQHLHHGQYRPLIVLSDAERKTLEHLVVHATEVAVVRRGQALLWLNAGETISAVANRFQVDPATIAAWMRRFRRSSFADFMVWLTERLPYSRPRPLVVLSDQERSALEALVAHTTAAAVVRRARALLWLHTGETVAEVAQRIGVSRYAIYTWVQGFQDAHTSDIGQRLAARPPYRQSRAVRARLEPLIRAVLEHDPRALGYHATAWTAMLLSQYLRQEHGITASNQRISHLLRHLDWQG
ncbi:MAG TPA: helix-turn-helix domain-containing protein [Candidatus Tectomicrobia bacterium]